ncbi:hydrolase [Nocardia vulneris]|uniref:Hydrolase n=1 Tax=Nocardia vulneris TaxID=1141657 RepID=A0ABR4ZEG0_9NOCA|nr:hydrolase [Nocardia vulneris]
MLLAGAGPAAAQPDDPNSPPVAGGPLGLYPKTVQGDIHRQFAQPGEHKVATSQQLHKSCTELGLPIGPLVLWLAGGTDVSNMQCTTAFPRGLDSPIGMMYYYPADIQNMAPAPVVEFEGGVLTDPGHYASIASLWASRGYVVAMPYNFINSLPTDAIWGTQALLAEEARPDSPLHGRVDFSRTVVAGQSGGAGAAYWAANYLPEVAPLLDPRLKVIGALSMNTGIQAPGGLFIKVPTLSLTGNLDVVTPDMLWPRLIDFRTTFQAPAYIACVINGTHGGSFNDIPNNPFAGASMAWLEHLTGGNPDADKVFVGPKWGLSTDAAFMAVERNTLADQLQ